MKNQIWYSGTKKDITQMREGELYLTLDKKYALMVAGKSKTARILHIRCAKGKSIDIPYNRLTSGKIAKARKEGYRYVDSAMGAGNFIRVSLFPDKDLKIIKHEPTKNTSSIVNNVMGRLSTNG